MKYIKTYEKPIVKSKLKLLNNYLKRKKVNVQFMEADARESTREMINGGDFHIFINYNRDNKPSFIVNHMTDVVINSNGERAGHWFKEYFKLNDFNGVYEFVKDIVNNNDFKLDVKKYNL